MTKQLFRSTLIFALLLTLAACGAPRPKPAGNLARHLHNETQAIEEYQAALKEEPDSVSLLTGLGRAYFNLGEYDKAAQQFLAATEVEPYPQASFYLGLATIGKGDRDNGFALLKDFRFVGDAYITESVQDAARRLEPQPTLSMDEIAREMFAAWETGVHRGQPAHPQKK